MNSDQSLQPKLAEIIEEMFLVLTNKEKDVIIQRFSLDNKPKRTLEFIGQKFSVTRERIRQIEKIALSKLRRTVKATRLNLVNEAAIEIVNTKGGVILEKELVDQILNTIQSSEKIDANIVLLALSINPHLSKIEKRQTSKPFWRQNSIDAKIIFKIISIALKALKKQKDVLLNAKIITQIRQSFDNELKDFADSTIIACLQTDKRLKQTETGFGLMSWRHINPKSIRDKAYIILKNSKKPLHFIDIAKKIEDAQFNAKSVTVQAVHNELIRYDQFVLVGRGLYTLKEFGFQKGTVSEIIENLLREHAPLSKQEIIDGVLRQRQVKKGTISLNLQKNPQFVRVGRAVYTLDESLKAK